MKRVIDLKQDEWYVNQYVDLRNLYKKVLMTKHVTCEETKVWLKRSDIEIRCLIENDVLIGAVILYLKRNAEVALFTKKKRAGIGSRLLNIIEDVAGERNINEVRAWVLCTNEAAKKTFINNGYKRIEESCREYSGSLCKGFDFRKTIRHN